MVRGLALALAVGLGGCDALLDVDNPNNVIEEDLRNATSVNAIVNGALAVASEAVGDVALSTSAIADELEHTGSQNWAAELNVGSIVNPEGRSDELFNDLSEARWLAEEAVRATEEFSGELTNPADATRALLYSGIVLMTIADNFEDFTFSDRTEVSPPVGEENMVTVYDRAMERFQAAEVAAGAVGRDDLALAARAFQARTAWARALWGKLNPKGSTPSNPLIDDPVANAAAAGVLASLTDEDWAYRFTFSSNDQQSPQGSWINSRQEFVVGPRYAVADETGKRVESIRLEDPLDGGPDPALQATVNGFVDDFLYPPVTLVSARELRLILAESALASGNEAAAVDQINAVRTLKGASAFDPATDALSTAELLQHERRVNLFFQPTRRIWDMYRFGVTADSWAPGSDAMQTGQMFVIGQDERISNCYILGTC